MNRINTTCCALGMSLLLAACAGDLGAAKDASKKAAFIVSEMQRTTSASIASQGTYQDATLSGVKDLREGTDTSKAEEMRHVGTWQALDPDARSTKLLGTMQSVTPDSALASTAPFIVMEPLPVFAAPTIDDKTFTNVISKLNKLSKGLSPLDRATALLPFIEATAQKMNEVSNAKQPTGVPAGLKTATQANVLTGMSIASEPVKQLQQAPRAAGTIDPKIVTLPEALARTAQTQTSSNPAGQAYFNALMQ